ncbi:MAG TPA: hypothetical protein VFX65_13875 [Candidatus Limnocylindrales bacterium]|nr:hypothetical protein [Candidatus Limnocylindrales bacterium]
MIAVCGDLHAPDSEAVAAASIASRAAAAGATVEVVGVVPDDPAGDGRLIELASAGVGHAAVLRGPARDLEAADLDLALRYLPEVRVIVAVALRPDSLETAAARAAWAGSALVVLARADEAAAPPSSALPDDAIVVEAPQTDPDSTFAGFVAALAARLDGGESARDAWAATVRALAVDPA